MDEARLRELVLDKPAPVPLLAVQAFANTIDVETATDRLDSAGSLTEWLREAGLAGPRLRAGGAELERARRLRDGLRELIAADRNLDPAGPAASLPELAGELPLRVRVAGGAPAPDLSPADSVDEVASALVSVALAAAADGSWERLKICHNDECRWVFFDGSRNRRGTWCSMEVCGNRIKNRSYRRRRAAVR